jgi:hypothetical protein
VENGFAGIEEKLKRANENIRNLDAEIAGFFQECRYPVVPENNNELLLDAIKYHQQLVIPPRFSVLVGEIIHHLRSCLDHVVWIFSCEEYRVSKFRKIEFSIFEKRPVDKMSRSLYEGKIKGITNPQVLSLIEQLQPYNTLDPVESPLFIIHNFDVIDKHRELVVFSTAGIREIPKHIDAVFESYKSAHPELTSADLAMKFKGHGKLVPNIAFSNFARREAEPVIEGLVELFNYVVKLMGTFEQCL